MPTPQEIRRIRLENDHKEMRNIQGSIISFTAKGTPPDEYTVTVKVRGIIGPGPDYRDEHRLRVRLPADYPASAPEIVMLSKPQPYHPNWFSSGKWCFGTWDMAEGLGHYVVRMIRTLQYDTEITNERSPANSDANHWYVNNRHKGFFPCDRQDLPDPTKLRFEIKSLQREKSIDRKFIIK